MLSLKRTSGNPPTPTPRRRGPCLVQRPQQLTSGIPPSAVLSPSPGPQPRQQPEGARELLSQLRPLLCRRPPTKGPSARRTPFAWSQALPRWCPPMPSQGVGPPVRQNTPTPTPGAPLVLPAEANHAESLLTQTFNRLPLLPQAQGLPLQGSGTWPVPPLPGPALLSPTPCPRRPRPQGLRLLSPAFVRPHPSLRLRDPRWGGFGSQGPSCGSDKVPVPGPGPPGPGLFPPGSLVTGSALPSGMG